MSARTTNLLVWFGVVGGGLAWAVQFVANLAFGWARCNPPVTRWALPVHGWEIALSAGALVIGLASLGTAILILVRTKGGGVLQQGLRGEGPAPPIGRINFLAVVGIVVNFLAIAIIVITGIGAPMLQVCKQS